MNNKNISIVVKEKLCTSCGVCSAACPYNCITIQKNKKNCIPFIDRTKCINCGICIRVCPGYGIELLGLTKRLYEQELSVRYSKSAGYFIETLAGYTLDCDMRFHSASGGVVSAFLIYLLEKKYIDGALVLGYSRLNIFEPYSYIATTKEQILASRGSKYIVSSLDNALMDLKSFNGRVVVVGLPCQIQGIRKWASINKEIKSKIIGYLAIYCSLNKTRNSIDYYLSHYKIDGRKVKNFSFRDDGCLGYMKFTGFDDKVIKKIPYMSYWHGTHSFFTNERCTVCIDHFGELADISFGDINIKPYNEDKIGVSSIVVRSTKWRNLLNLAVDDGALCLKPIPMEYICNSQIYSKYYKKGPGVIVNYWLRKIRGLSNPRYDYTYDGKIPIKIFFKEIANMIMRWVGTHKSLWFIIHLLDKSK